MFFGRFSRAPRSHVPSRGKGGAWQVDRSTKEEGSGKVGGGQDADGKRRSE